MHKAELLSAAEVDLPGLITSLVTNYSSDTADICSLTKHLLVTSLPASSGGAGVHALVVRILPSVTEPDTWLTSKAEMDVGLGKSKQASRNLRIALPAICERAHQAFASAGPDRQVLVACESGKDLSVGLALALDCWCFDDSGQLRPDGGKKIMFTKDSIRVRLSRIMTAMPGANPSRATLQSVNSFLMS
jgi:tRNA A64-2'-O-ribosylphosphate transferase